MRERLLIGYISNSEISFSGEENSTWFCGRGMILRKIKVS